MCGQGSCCHGHGSNNMGRPESSPGPAAAAENGINVILESRHEDCGGTCQHDHGGHDHEDHQHNHTDHRHLHSHGHDHDHDHDHNQCSNSHDHAHVHTSECTTKCNNSLNPTPKQSVEFLGRLHREDDPEAGPAEYTHRVISVQSPPCTCCDGPIRNALGKVPGVLPSSVKVSLISNRAEFDARDYIPTQEIIQLFQQNSGLTATEIIVGAVYVDVLLQLDQPEITQDDLRIVRLDKKTARVHYDPAVGARQVLQDNGWELAPEKGDPGLLATRRQLRHSVIVTLISAILTIPTACIAWIPAERSYNEELKFLIVSLVLATLVQCIAAYEFLIPAARALILSRAIEMDALVAMSTFAAYIFSVVAFSFFVLHKPLETGEFFETSTMLVTLVLLGRLLSEASRHKATSKVSMRAFQTPTADVVQPELGVIDARLLKVGDIIRIQPHTRFVTDGILKEGVTEADESMITGESVPVHKPVGAAVIAGSMNGDGDVRIRVVKLPSENTIAEIAALVDRAALDKPRVQQLADRVAGCMVPVILLVAIIVFLAQFLSKNSSAVKAVTYGVATLIVSCPCAIGLAVPMVVIIAAGVAAKAGILIKEPQVIESAKKIRHVVFDKTGTLTHSTPSVSFASWQEGTPVPKKEMQSALLALVEAQAHPVSRAVAAHLRSQNVVPAAVADIKSVPGQGVTGTYAGHTILAGKPAFAGVHSGEISQAYENQQSVMAVSIGDCPAAVFSLKNEPRHNAREVVQELQKSKIQVHIVSGDAGPVVRGVAAQLGVHHLNVLAEALPADKLAYINKLSNVMFVGDGTNDAPALKAADVGVHFPESHSSNDILPSAEAKEGEATAVADTKTVSSSAANVVLSTPDLGRILALMSISRHAMIRVWVNFGWAFVYNLVAILGASGALEKVGSGGFRIPPAFAAVGEIVSVLPVVLIGISLRWKKF